MEDDVPPMCSLGVLVEGAQLDDAEFYGNWLLAASKAEALLKEAFDDPDFEKQVSRLTVIYIPDFGIAAILFLLRLKGNVSSFVINFCDDEGVDFVLMTELGFFLRTARGYQMAIPTDLTLTKVKAAALTYAQTEDDVSFLHPEVVVYLMPLAEALQSQMRELAISRFREDDRPPDLS